MGYMCCDGIMPNESHKEMIAHLTTGVAVISNNVSPLNDLKANTTASAPKFPNKLDAQAANTLELRLKNRVVFLANLAKKSQRRAKLRER